MLFYKNVSTVLLKRLFANSDVILMVLLLCLLFIIDLRVSVHLINYLNFFAYATGVLTWIISDAVEIKYNTLVFLAGFLFLLAALLNVLSRTILDVDEGIKWLSVGNIVLYARDTRRSIFLNIFTLLLRAFVVMVKDVLDGDLVYRSYGHLDFTETSHMLFIAKPAFRPKYQYNARRPSVIANQEGPVENVTSKVLSRVRIGQRILAVTAMTYIALFIYWIFTHANYEGLLLMLIILPFINQQHL
jgi:hypothetical protein